MSIMKIDVESFADSRASRYFDLFPELQGQITVSVIHPNEFSGWHKHQRQTDQFFVASGKVKIGIITPDGEIIEEVLSSEFPRTIVIPPHHWHAWRNMAAQSFLVYHLSQKHDETDEFRGSIEEIKKQFNYEL